VPDSNKWIWMEARAAATSPNTRFMMLAQLFRWNPRRDVGGALWDVSDRPGSAFTASGIRPSAPIPP
jgi:hypothetical protein